MYIELLCILWRTYQIQSYSIKFNIQCHKKHRSASAIGRFTAEKVSSTNTGSPPVMRRGARRSVVSNTSNHTHTHTHSRTEAKAEAWCLLIHTEASLSRGPGRKPGASSHTLNRMSLSRTHTHTSLTSLTCSCFRRRRRGGTPGAGTRGNTSSSAHTASAPRPRHPSQRVRIITLAASWHDFDSDNEGQQMW
jgi:hypothetical protein